VVEQNTQRERTPTSALSIRCGETNQRERRRSGIICVRLGRRRRAWAPFVLGGGNSGVRASSAFVLGGGVGPGHHSSWAAGTAAFGHHLRTSWAAEAAAFGSGHRSSWAAAAFGFPGDTPVKNMKRVREYEEVSGEPRVFSLLFHFDLF
jgi:hypothetical protein